MSYDQHFRDLSDLKNVKSVSSAFHQAMFFFCFTKQSFLSFGWKRGILKLTRSFKIWCIMQKLNVVSVAAAQCAEIVIEMLCYTREGPRAIEQRVTNLTVRILTILPNHCLSHIRYPARYLRIVSLQGGSFNKKYALAYSADA